MAAPSVNQNYMNSSLHNGNRIFDPELNFFRVRIWGNKDVKSMEVVIKLRLGLVELWLIRV